MLAANERFYAAFEGRNLDAMSAVWEHDPRVVCTHPGWATLRGWGAVAASWFALFQGPVPIQFILTDVHVAVAGDLAWVSLDENVIGEQLGSTVAALNLFVRAADGWLMVAHHGSAVGLIGLTVCLFVLDAIAALWGGHGVEFVGGERERQPGGASAGVARSSRLGGRPARTRPWPSASARR